MTKNEIKVTSVNTSNALREYIEHLKQDISNIFNRVSCNGEVVIINDFPAVTEQLGKISLLIFINIPYEKGSYYCYEKGKYLNSLILGINFVSDNNIIDIEEGNYIAEDGSFSYIEELEKQSKKFKNWAYETLEGCNLIQKRFLNCVFFDWVRADGMQSATFEDDYIVVNKRLPIRHIINKACHRINAEGKKYRGCESFTLNKNVKLSHFVNFLIDKANEETTFGILTKKKIDMITRPTQITKRISELQGGKLCLITGKAGSGKTLALMRALNEIISQRKRARLLTYNNLLAMDIKQYLRNISPFNSANASIQTLHKFFYDLSLRLRIQTLLSWDRIEELISICEERVNLAEQIIDNHLESYEGLSYINEDIIEKWLFESDIDKSDRDEIKSYLNEVIRNLIPNKEDRISRYITGKRAILEKEVGKNIFIEDYNKVLETIYLAIDDTPQFFEKFSIANKPKFIPIIDQEKIYKDFKVQNRRELLSKIRQTDVVIEDEQEVTIDEVNLFITKRITPKITWSNSILIDEGQDCNIYEKLILMKLRGAENLIVASGGREQLIRKATEIDWHVAAGVPVQCEDISLGRKTHRLKGNIVRFVNEFNQFYSLSSPLQQIDELDAKGEVIIDYSNSYLPVSIIEECRKKGEIMGCTPYESMMFLLPGMGYSTKGKKEEQIKIDENDYVEQRTIISQRHLEIPELPSIRFWDGTGDGKSKLNLPNQTQTRCIHFDSCRGLEAWSIFCINIDVFYQMKKESKDAEKYAIEQNELFIEKEKLQCNYALLWCNMAFTRAIDTLYINVKDKDSDFSKNLLTIARRCGNSVRIITD